jgi:hypothetical protein
LAAVDESLVNLPQRAVMDSAKKSPRQIEDLSCQLLEKRIGMGAETLGNFHHFGGVVETPNLRSSPPRNLTIFMHFCR